MSRIKHEVPSRGSRCKRQNGLGLIEIMVGLALLGILFAGLVELFVGSTRNANTSDSLSRLEETGRITLQVLSADIRRAGHFGGNAGVATVRGSLAQAASAKTCVAASTNWARMVDQPILGINDGKSDTKTTYACITDAEYLRGDVITLRFSDSWARDPNELVTDKLYIKTNLVDGRIFKGQDEAASQNSLNDPSAEIYELVANSYFVGNSGRSCRGQPIPALLRKSIGGTGLPVTQELIPGVEHMQFRYKVNGRYFEAHELTDWDSVGAVEINVLVRAECTESGFTNDRTFPMADLATPYGPVDAFRRQLFTTLVTLRN